MNKTRFMLNRTVVRQYSNSEYLFDEEDDVTLNFGSKQSEKHAEVYRREFGNKSLSIVSLGEILQKLSQKNYPDPEEYPALLARLKTLLKPKNVEVRLSYMKNKEVQASLAFILSELAKKGNNSDLIQILLLRPLLIEKNLRNTMDTRTFLMVINKLASSDNFEDLTLDELFTIVGQLKVFNHLYLKLSREIDSRVDSLPLHDESIMRNYLQLYKLASFSISSANNSSLINKLIKRKAELLDLPFSFKLSILKRINSIRFFYDELYVIENELSQNIMDQFNPNDSKEQTVMFFNLNLISDSNVPAFKTFMSENTLGYIKNDFIRISPTILNLLLQFYAKNVNNTYISSLIENIASVDGLIEENLNQKFFASEIIRNTRQQNTFFKLQQILAKPILNILKQNITRIPINFIQYFFFLTKDGLIEFLNEFDPTENDKHKILATIKIMSHVHGVTLKPEFEELCEDISSDYYDDILYSFPYRIPENRQASIFNLLNYEKLSVSKIFVFSYLLPRYASELQSGSNVLGDIEHIRRQIIHLKDLPKNFNECKLLFNSHIQFISNDFGRTSVDSLASLLLTDHYMIQWSKDGLDLLVSGLTELVKEIKDKADLTTTKRSSVLGLLKLIYILFHNKTLNESIKNNGQHNLFSQCLDLSAAVNSNIFVWKFINLTQRGIKFDIENVDYFIDKVINGQKNQHNVINKIFSFYNLYPEAFQREDRMEYLNDLCEQAKSKPVSDYWVYLKHPKMTDSEIWEMLKDEESFNTMESKNLILTFGNLLYRHLITGEDLLIEKILDKLESVQPQTINCEQSVFAIMNTIVTNFEVFNKNKRLLDVFNKLFDGLIIHNISRTNMKMLIKFKKTIEGDFSNFFDNPKITGFTKKVLLLQLVYDKEALPMIKAIFENKNNYPYFNFAYRKKMQIYLFFMLNKLQNKELFEYAMQSLSKMNVKMRLRLNSELVLGTYIKLFYPENTDKLVFEKELTMFVNNAIVFDKIFSSLGLVPEYIKSVGDLNFPALIVNDTVIVEGLYGSVREMIAEKLFPGKKVVIANFLLKEDRSVENLERFLMESGFIENPLTEEQRSTFKVLLDNFDTNNASEKQAENEDFSDADLPEDVDEIAEAVSEDN